MLFVYLSPLVILLTFSFSIYAQDPLAGRDLTNIKVDALSENQISAIQQRLKQSGLTIDQLQSQAIAKGMSTEEFSKLKDRVNGISGIAGIVMAKTVKKWLSDVAGYPMDLQKKLLLESWETWRGHDKQTDDVILIGIKFPYELLHQ